MPKPKPAMKVMIIQAVRSCQAHGSRKARLTTAAEAKTKGLRRPSLSESGPDTTVETMMPTRLSSPRSGITVSGRSMPK
jgi:hypothetical protein